MNVAISQTTSLYPEIPPYNPCEWYPEYKLEEISIEPNEVYAAVRENFYLLGLDEKNYGKPNWNPLGNIIKPGDTVFVKPNFVDHKHRFTDELWTVITHPSVIRAVCDYVVIALEGKGKILIGDNPHADAKFEIIKEKCHLDVLSNLYNKNELICEIVDLRYWHVPDLKYYGFKEGRVGLPGDPLNASKITVGKESLLTNRSTILFRGTYTDRFETIKQHLFNKHTYVVSNSILSANVYISIPKLKSHAKVGATLNIKGLIGTIAEKNALVHWCIGYPLFGGDEYPSPQKFRDYLKLYLQHLFLDLLPSRVYFFLRNFFNKKWIGRLYNRIIDTDYQKKRMLRGAWEGNETTWRMTVDVFNAVIKDCTGLRRKKGWQLKTFSVVDGIVGGDTDGPHFPNKVESKVIISGEDFIAVDAVCVRLMDFNIDIVKYLKHLLSQYRISLSEISVRSKQFDIQNFFDKDKGYLGFRPPYRWPSLSLKNIEPGKSFLPVKSVHKPV
ncbi:MAG: DUF362 domain-containing protein [Melioribacteraceae bacterium]